MVQSSGEEGGVKGGTERGRRSGGEGWAELPSLIRLLQVSYVLELESCLHPVLDMIEPDKQV